MTGLRAQLAALAAVLMLAACASAPHIPTSSTPAAAPPASAEPHHSPSPAAPRKKGGGYYQDDGPDDNPPDNLDAVPDATPQREPLHKFANNPYSVFGIDYKPAKELKPYKARGRASWYGKKFHNQKTSSGERYDMYAMTAAHPTLPIPSYARVTNISNGRSVVVRINDRGPFHSNRVMDLSYTAAYKLGYLERGSAEVLVEAIIPEGVELVASNIPPLTGNNAKANHTAVTRAEADSIAATALPPDPAAPPDDPDPIARIAALESPVLSDAAPPLVASQSGLPTKGLFLQLGAFSNEKNAQDFRGLVEQDLAWLSGKLNLYNENARYRLLAGPYASSAEARSAAERITAKLKLKPFVVQH